MRSTAVFDILWRMIYPVNISKNKESEKYGKEKGTIH